MFIPMTDLDLATEFDLGRITTQQFSDEMKKRIFERARVGSQFASSAHQSRSQEDYSRNQLRLGNFEAPLAKP